MLAMYAVFFTFKERTLFIEPMRSRFSQLAHVHKHSKDNFIYVWIYFIVQVDLKLISFSQQWSF